MTTGRVHHLSSFHAISFGEQDGTRTARVEAVAEALGGSGFEARLSDHILAEMWSKWVFIAAAASLGCLLRAQVGDIVAAGAQSYGTALLEECAAIAARHDFPQDPKGMEFGEKMLSEAGSEFKPSMLRDIERGQRTEAHHIVSDLLRRGGDLPSTILAHCRRASESLRDAPGPRKRRLTSLKKEKRRASRSGRSARAASPRITSKPSAM